ncbi:heat shock 70 kDa protein 12A-like [Xiphophorus maculatus]|uniref:heat shock 70 kDa protein 12A-like n=1 Tax=Xiphophorus maculatus TaxID=8083 RepID=UPI000C6CA522|nr:heat shock 70 kDa protein 12A-like [Xiphophorus maculatus]
MEDSFIIAIDFGTAYSGYAFSITSSEEEIVPRVKEWGEEVGLETPKTPTCILFDENKTFHSFGYKAKNDYLSMERKKAIKMFFFDCFKMSLYNKMLSRDLMIKAANGKEMTAMTVFTEGLRFLKDDALTTINESATGITFEASDFTWVLTVPAIWDPSAKQFMKEAATQAGIVTPQNELVIALEPEAASIWCKKLPPKGFIAENRGEDKLDQSPGTQYIVVDCGGGTIDITVHEVISGRNLKELHKASGNDLGGQTVDKQFKKFLKEIFCNGVWDEYEKSYPNEIQKIMYEFAIAKKRDDDIDITCPLNLATLAKKTHKKIEKFFKNVEGASWNDGSIKIFKQKLRSFFAQSLQGITLSLREILQKCFNIQYILLVGGYADSKILRRHITDEFIDQCKVLCPFRPQEAIVKGAVDFGRNQGVVAFRKSAFTYGISVYERFDASKHKPEKKYKNKHGEWCKNIFMKMLQIDEDVGWNQVKNFNLYPVDSDQTSLSYKFYRTKHENPQYVDEEEVEKIGSFVVDSPNTALGLNRKTEVNIEFGFTEMKATATDIDSGSTESIKLDFLTN